VRLAWITDLHLDFVQDADLSRFLGELEACAADAYLVGGDIAQAATVARHLRVIASRLRRPVYFVLGNHDFYGGSIARVRVAVTALMERSPYLHWLPARGVVPLTRATALVGHDGWGDARLGTPATSPIRLNDFALIDELKGLDRATLHARLRALGDEAGAHLRTVLPEALASFARVLVLTHVPPFREACWHGGAIASDDWLVYFACAAAGEALREALRGAPDRTCTVLCGHTHSGGRAAILPNLLAWTASAQYGTPRIEQVLEVE